MSGLFGGNKTSNTTVNTTQPPSQYLAAYENVLNKAQGVANQGYKSYPGLGSLVAPLTPAQNQAGAEVANAQGVANPYIAAGTQALQSAQAPLWSSVQQFSPQAVQQYESPYTQQVVQATQNQFNNLNAQQSQGLTSSAISQNAFGGDRAAVAQGILGGQQASAEAPVLAGLENTGYQQALGEFNQQQQGQLGANEANAWLNSQAAFGYGNLGQEAQSTALTGASALNQIGTQQQQQQQAQNNVPYENWIAQQAWPYQQTGWLAGIAEGTGSNAGGTSTSTAPAPSTASQVGGALAGTAGVLGATGAFGSNGWLTGSGGIFYRGGVIPGRAPGGSTPYIPTIGSPFGDAGFGQHPSVPGLPIAPGGDTGALAGVMAGQPQPSSGASINPAGGVMAPSISSPLGGQSAPGPSSDTEPMHSWASGPNIGGKIGGVAGGVLGSGAAGLLGGVAGAYGGKSLGNWIGNQFGLGDTTKFAGMPGSENAISAEQVNNAPSGQSASPMAEGVRISIEGGDHPNTGGGAAGGGGDGGNGTVGGGGWSSGAASGSDSVNNPGNARGGVIQWHGPVKRAAGGVIGYADGGGADGPLQSALDYQYVPDVPTVSGPPVGQAGNPLLDPDNQGALLGGLPAGSRARTGLMADSGGNVSSPVGALAGTQPQTTGNDYLSRMPEGHRPDPVHVAQTHADPWMALAEAGFATMAGTSPFALANIGRGAMAGLREYQQDKQERERNALGQAGVELGNQRDQLTYEGQQAANVRSALGLESGENRANIRAQAMENAADIRANATLAGIDARAAGAAKQPNWIPLPGTDDNGNVVLYNQKDPTQTVTGGHVTARPAAEKPISDEALTEKAASLAQQALGNLNATSSPYAPKTKEEADKFIEDQTSHFKRLLRPGAAAQSAPAQQPASPAVASGMPQIGGPPVLHNDGYLYMRLNDGTLIKRAPDLTPPGVAPP
jgi:hypothetical protein